MKKTNVNETINKTNMEDDTMKTMKNYKEMNWVEVVAYAKELGINPGHKKRTVIEAEIEERFAPIEVVAGDMTTDIYYPALQTEEPVVEVKVNTKALTEQKIKAAINRVSYNATYNNMPVRYINAKSLATIIKYNLAKRLRTEENIAKVIAGLINNNVLYKCNKDKEFYGVK